LKNSVREQPIILFVSALTLISFLLMAFFRSSFTALDMSVNSWSASIHVSSFTEIAIIIWYGFDTTSLLAVSLLMSAYFFYRNYRKNASLLVGAMVGDAAIITVAKILVHSARPLNGMIQESGFSFPSGHATSTTVFFGLLTYFIWQRWKSSNAKALSTMFFVVMAFLVGFSRVYLNVHWLSDVLGGYLLGVFWLTFSILAIQHLERITKFQK